MNNDELTPSEKKAFETLPKERMPSASLEERIVRALHHRGILQSQRGRMVEKTSLRIVCAIAASIVLVVVGFALGRWTGPQRITPADTTFFFSEDISVAASLQQAGTAYVMALENLASLPDSAYSEEMLQGREVALSTLYTAADQVTRIVPKNYLAGQLLQAINVGGEIQTNGAAGGGRQQVIWF